MRVLAWLTLAALVAPSDALAKVRSMALEELIRSSDMIVVARVESVERSLLGRRHAQARVEEVWKGEAVAYVRFLASPTWTCDISEALKGESVVLFLQKEDSGRPFVLALAGRGRLPIRHVEGAAYADFWPEVVLPEGLPLISGPEPEWPFIRSVDLEALRRAVASALGHK